MRLCSACKPDSCRLVGIPTKAPILFEAIERDADIIIVARHGRPRLTRHLALGVVVVWIRGSLVVEDAQGAELTLDRNFAIVALLDVAPGVHPVRRRPVALLLQHRG